MRMKWKSIKKKKGGGGEEERKFKSLKEEDNENLNSQSARQGNPILILLTIHLKGYVEHKMYMNSVFLMISISVSLSPLFPSLFIQTYLGLIISIHNPIKIINVFNYQFLNIFPSNNS